MGTTVSALVVNWNGGDQVLECIASLDAQSRRPDEIIVVDNASEDGSPEALRARYPALRLIRNGRNVGFGAGVNQAAACATGEWLALLNNDARADRHWLAELLRCAAAQPDAGMIACKIYLDRGARVLDKVGHRIALDGQNFGRGHGQRDDGRYEALAEVAWPDGCAGLWRRSVFEQLRGFDEEFFAYADDADLGIRYQLAGWRCALAPAAIVEHAHSQTLGAYSPEKLFLVERNRIWLAAKYFPWPLLLGNPLLWSWRAVLTWLAQRRGAGSWSRVPAGQRGRVIGALLRAQLAGWRGLPAQLGKRRELEQICGPGWQDRLRRLLQRERVSLAALARAEVP